MSLADLAHDMRAIAKGARPAMTKVLRKDIKEGSKMARANAKRTAGHHGIHYPGTITTEVHSGGLSAEYGPDSAMPQGGMSFEFGSRNQKPHLDLARSADVIGPKFRGDVSDAIRDLYAKHGFH